MSISSSVDWQKDLAPQYEVLGQLGISDHSQVFKARDCVCNETVALKYVPTQKGTSKRSALAEISLLLAIDHPNLVHCLDIQYLAEGSFVIVYEFVEGGDLRDLIDRGFSFSLEEWCDCAIQLLGALGALHACNIMHQDIKPENILVAEKEGKKVYKIADFGVARIHDPTNLVSTKGSGSPAYMAPEAFNGRATFSSDIYSIGVILYELLTGHRPFSGSIKELAKAHSHDSPDFSGIPWSGVQVALGMLLQKTVASRLSDTSGISQIIKALSSNPKAEDVCIDIAYSEPPVFAFKFPRIEKNGLFDPESCKFKRLGTFETEIPFSAFEPVVLSRRSFVLIGDSSRLHLHGGELINQQNLFVRVKEMSIRTLCRQGFVRSNSTSMEFWDSDTVDPMHIEELGLRVSHQAFDQNLGMIAWAESGKLFLRKWQTRGAREYSSVINSSAMIRHIDFWRDRIVVVQGMLKPTLNLYTFDCEFEQCIDLPGPVIQASQAGVPGYLCWNNLENSNNGPCLVTLSDSYKMHILPLNQEAYGFNRFSSYGAILLSAENEFTLADNTGNLRGFGIFSDHPSQRLAVSPGGDFYYTYSEGVEDRQVTVYRRS